MNLLLQTNRRDFLKNTAAAALALSPTLRGLASELKEANKLPPPIELDKALDSNASIWSVGEKKFVTTTLRTALKGKQHVAVFSMGAGCPHSEALMEVVCQMAKKLPEQSQVVVVINAGQENTKDWVSGYKALGIKNLTIVADGQMQVLNSLELKVASVFHELHADDAGKLRLVPTPDVTLPEGGRVSGKAPWRVATKETYVGIASKLGGSELGKEIARIFPKQFDKIMYACALAPEQ